MVLTRTFTLVVTLTLCFSASLSHAATFWDDELEAGNTGYPSFFNGTFGSCGGQSSFVNDTANKVSGNASLRMNFPGHEWRQQCGGFADRTHPQTHELWVRYYIRLSPGFEVDSIGTKLNRTDGTGTGWWWVMKWGLPVISIELQGWPTNNDTTQLNPNVGSGVLKTDGTWHCIEFRILNNSVVDQPTGKIEAWRDGVKFMDHTGAWRRSGQFTQNNVWQSNRFYRQDGKGSISWDRFAVGNTRIGCLGTNNQSNTSPPAPPTGLAVR
jgi:hypothetical protein